MAEKKESKDVNEAVKVAIRVEKTKPSRIGVARWEEKSSVWQPHEVTDNVCCQRGCQIARAHEEQGGYEAKYGRV